MIKKTVLDLTAGLGGRTYAFQKMGFEIVGVIDNDAENCKVIDTWLYSRNLKYADLLEVDPNVLPDADIITAKYMQHAAVENGLRMYSSKEYINDAIYNIIKVKNPALFLLEVPVSSFGRGREVLEKYLQRFLYEGYKITYTLYQEGHVSGYPVIGKQGYIVGHRLNTEKEFRFPEERLFGKEREVVFENIEEIFPWYRKVGVPTEAWENGSWYLRFNGKVEKTDTIHMGYMRENYLVDHIGARRFTHNELAWLKGLDNYNYNMCSNKSRMYNKIAYASNVYVVSAIVEEIRRFVTGEEKKKRVKQEPIEVTKKKRNKKASSEEVLFPKYRLESITIDKLKGINNLTLKFDKNLTALMGVNGSGKSTIIHALACVYAPYKDAENYKFSYFFTPNPHASWKGSRFTVVSFDERNKKTISRSYSKEGTRWANYSNRIKRNVHYLGVSTGLPAIEIEKKTSFINYVSNKEKSKLDEKVINDAAYILNKNYEELMSHTLGRKKYVGVHTKDGIVYSALSMGAGEQRVIKILQTVYSAYQYSLILIDEIDLLLHADAFKKLIERLHKIAKDRNLQIIFTTHALEMNDLCEYADIRYIEQQKERTLVYDSIKPDLIYQLNGEMERRYTIYVEDEFASAIVRKVAFDMKMLRHINILQFGSIENSFVVAVGKVLGGDDINNILIVTDGDKYISEDEKRTRINSILTGSEIGREKKIQRAQSIISQFNLPVGLKPEEYIHGKLIRMEDDNEIVRCAKSLRNVDDSHKLITEIGERLGLGKRIYEHIMEIVPKDSEWEQYIENVKIWLEGKREEVEVVSMTSLIEN